jgi:MoxR-like ATPase
VLALVEAARAVHVEDSLARYVVALLRATRAEPRFFLGASPRAGIALLRVAKARALAEGRDYATADDVKAVAAPVLIHRMILSPESTDADCAQLLRAVLERTPVPV